MDGRSKIFDYRLSAISVAMLVDRGQLQYTDTIAQYWPEFVCEGKDVITVQQDLQHEVAHFFICLPTN